MYLIKLALNTFKILLKLKTKLNIVFVYFSWKNLLWIDGFLECYKLSAINCILGFRFRGFYKN